MEKRMVVGILLLAMFLISGCAVSDYLTGQDVKAVGNSTENASDKSSEIDNILKELEDESAGGAKDAVELKEGTAPNNSTKPAQQKTETKADASAVTIKVKEGEKVRLKPVAQDPDKDKILYTFSTPLNSNGEWQTDYGDAGKYKITVTASDGKLKTSKVVDLVVERVNVAPVINNVEDMAVDEGTTLSLSPKVSDPNGDKVTVTISDPVGNDGVWEIGYQKAGVYPVTVKATDGEKETSKKVTVTVNHKNIAPDVKVVDSLTVKEGETVTIKPEVSDVNGDKISLSISLPVGNDGVWETGYSDNGKYDVVVKASDGTTTTTKTVKVTVLDVNMAPVIVDIQQQG